MKKKKVTRKPASRARTEETITTSILPETSIQIQTNLQTEVDVSLPVLEGKQGLNSQGPSTEGNQLHLVDDELVKDMDSNVGKDDFQASAQSHWVNLRDKLQLNETSKLHYEEPMLKNGKKVAQIDLDEVSEQAQNWNSAMICMVLGANPPFAVFEGFVKRIWCHLGVERVVRMHMDLTIVKFNDEAARDFVLENGIVQFDRKPVIVRPWTQDLDSIRLVRSVPLWIRLPNLGLQYWGKNCLSVLVSTIEKPIMVDKFTKDRSMIRFARVLVEMEITDDPPFIIHFVNERGQIQEQFVEYEWLPIKCSTCKGYGHNAAECKKTETKAWVTKSKLEQDSTNLAPDIVVTKAKAGETSEVQEEPKVVDTKNNTTETVTHEAAIQDRAPIQENKLKGDKVQDMISKVMVGWDYYSSTATEGRILVLWRRSFVNVQELVITFVYGFNLLTERLDMWRGLSSLSILNMPWLVVGDFNAVFNFDDRVGGREISANETVDSTTWLAHSHLAKLKCVGSNFTWSNKQEGGDRVYSKIDHAFINEGWIDSLLNSIAELHWEVYSDHCFFLIKTLTVGNLGVQPFRFFNCWITHSKFKETVMANWIKPMTARGL
ncbi:uncharacterized protein LOC133785445 [Humulus lupulus]|uniref:uncharacterized protein LOC133785445 n=1 Tax=Humulus lupulus TaxID=3486 RepID=UPI002B41690F|nr:uncharacterized protein LOC133785445 [Humulus lupulus]